MKDISKYQDLFRNQDRTRKTKLNLISKIFLNCATIIINKVLHSQIITDRIKMTQFLKCSRDLDKVTRSKLQRNTS